MLVTSQKLQTLKLNRVEVNDADYPAPATALLIAYVAIAAARQVTLPTPTAADAGRVWLVKDESGSASGINTITVVGAAAETFDGNPSAVINAAYGTLRVYTDGANFFLW